MGSDQPSESGRTSGAKSGGNADYEIVDDPQDDVDDKPLHKVGRSSSRQGLLSTRGEEDPDVEEKDHPYSMLHGGSVMSKASVDSHNSSYDTLKHHWEAGGAANSHYSTLDRSQPSNEGSAGTWRNSIKGGTSNPTYSTLDRGGKAMSLERGGEERVSENAYSRLQPREDAVTLPRNAPPTGEQFSPYSTLDASGRTKQQT